MVWKNRETLRQQRAQDARLVNDALLFPLSFSATSSLPSGQPGMQSLGEGLDTFYSAPLC